MSEFLATGRNWEHLLALLLLLARLGNIGSSYILTPTLRLSSNPLSRRLGWSFLWLSVLVSLVAYYNTGLAVVAIVISLCGTVSNLLRSWPVRALGEDEYLAALQRAAARKVSAAIALTLGSAGAFAVIGLLLMGLSGGPNQWPFWFAVGILLYAAGSALFDVRFVIRLSRESRQA